MGWQQRVRQDGYLAQAIRAYAMGIIPKGSLTIVDVYHDSWCPLLTGRRECTCHPDVEYRPMPAGADVDQVMAELRPRSGRC